MRIRGIITFAALAVAGAVGLSGCTVPSVNYAPADWQALGQSLATQAPQPSTAPQAGACWQLSYPAFLVEPAVPGEAQVNCSQPHQAYTFQVVDIDPGQSTPASGTTEAALQQQGKRDCSEQFSKLFPKASGGNSRMIVGTVVIPQSSWGTGELWARCDFLELGIGSEYLQPNFAPLPTSESALVSSVNASPHDYQLCVTTLGSNSNTGPELNSTTVIATCSTAQWTLEPSPNFPDPQGEAYPGYDKLESSFMHAHCGALYDTATTRGWVFYPSASQWAAGSRDFECWVGKR